MSSDFLTIETQLLTILLFKQNNCLEAHCYFRVSPNLKQKKLVYVTDSISLSAEDLRRRPLFIIKVKKHSAYCEHYNIHFCYLIHNARIILLDLLKWKEYL